MTLRNESRVLGGSAVAFAVSLFVYVTLIDLPDLTTTDEKTIEFYQESGHRAQSVVGGYVAALTTFFLVALLVGAVRILRQRGSSAAALAATVGGTAFASLFLAAAALFASPAFTLSLNNEPVALDDDFALMARATSAVGDSFFLTFAPFAAAVFVAAVTLGGRGAGGWPRWLVFLGWIAAVSLVAPLVFFSLLLLMIWCIAFGVRMLVTKSPSENEDAWSDGVDAVETGPQG
jgi:hypothetical protein